MKLGKLVLLSSSHCVRQEHINQGNKELKLWALDWELQKKQLGISEKTSLGTAQTLLKPTSGLAKLF